MADPIVNFYKSTLVGTYSDTDTSLTVATGDGALLPDPSVDGAFNLTIFEGLQVTGSTEFEIVRVTARSGDVLTVTRGQESTTPLTIGSATHSILMSATKKTFDDINDAIDNVNVTNLTGVEELTFDSTGDEEFGLPTGTTAQRPSSPSQGYMRYNTSDGIGVEVYNGNRWVPLGAGFAQLALEVAELSVTANDAVFLPALEVEYLVIAGGGGGGFEQAGAGGAGGYRSSVSGESSGGGASAESILELDASTNYTVTVGAGGAGDTSAGGTGTNGSNSVFNAITSTGGGGGGTIGSNGATGGSGGGGAYNGSGGAGTASQGFAGGAGDTDNTSYSGGGGGGGASQTGGNASASDAGAGGDGVSSSITGSAVTRAGGGGGGAFVSNAGAGGSGGGGTGGGPTGRDGSAGTVNTGGGGGGGGFVSGGGDGASGGSGVVILRYPSAYTITIGAGLTGSETTVGANKVATITAGTGNVSWS